MTHARNLRIFIAWAEIVAFMARSRVEFGGSMPSLLALTLCEFKRAGQEESRRRSGRTDEFTFLTFVVNPVWLGRG
jgi:hypothetical protein